MTVQEISAANMAEIVNNLYKSLEHHQAQAKKHKERAALHGKVNRRGGRRGPRQTTRKETT